MVLDGHGSDLELEYGTETLGVFAARVAPELETGCHEYYFAWTTEEGREGAFPEEGSYLYGSDCDNDLMWIESQLGGGALLEQDPSFNPELDIELVGCSQAGLSRAPGADTVSPRRTLIPLLFLSLLGILRRRASSPR